MSIFIKIAANCVATAILTVGMIMLMMEWESFLYRNGFFALMFFYERVPEPLLRPTVFIYDTTRYAVFGSMCAALMLGLRPRKIWLYASISACTLYYFSYMPTSFASFVSWDFFSFATAITWLISIPLLFVLFIRIEKV